MDLADADYRIFCLANPLSVDMLQLLCMSLQGKVVVIGAGPAGLGAAHQLTKLGAEVSSYCILICLLP